MQDNSKRKKLKLNRRTIKHLTDPDLRRVQGGTQDVQIKTRHAPPGQPLTPVFTSSFIFSCPTSNTEALSCCN